MATWRGRPWVQEGSHKMSRGKVEAPVGGSASFLNHKIDMELQEQWKARGDAEAGKGDGLFYVNKTINASEWEATQAKEAENPAYQVVVNGLPQSLLSHGMIEAILQQSGFYQHIRSFKASTGNGLGCSQVLISVEDPYMASCCQYHFHGRHWGGAYVTAELIAPEPTPEPAPSDDELYWPVELPDMSYDSSEAHWPLDLLASTTLPLAGSDSKAMSGRCWLEEATAALEKERIERCWDNREASSNGSTRDGGSESDD